MHKRQRHDAKGNRIVPILLKEDREVAIAREAHVRVGGVTMVDDKTLWPAAPTVMRRMHRKIGSVPAIGRAARVERTND